MVKICFVIILILELILNLLGVRMVFSVVSGIILVLSIVLIGFFCFFNGL